MGPSATFTIIRWHSTTSRVFHPLPGSTDIFIWLSTTCNNLQNHSATSRLISIFLGPSATFTILHHHSVTSRVFCPLPESTDIFLWLSTTYNNHQNNSVTFRSQDILSQPNFNPETKLVWPHNAVEPSTTPPPPTTETVKALPGSPRSWFSVCNLILTQRDELW